MCFGIALRALLCLCHKTSALIVRIVELGERVRELAPRDEKLETLGEPRCFGVFLRERRCLDGIAIHECGLDQPLFHKSVERRIQKLAAGLRFLDIEANAFCDFARLFICAIGEIRAGVLLDGIQHRQPAPGRRQINGRPLIDNFACVKKLLRTRVKQVFAEFHHIVHIGVSLVELNGREFGVMLDGHALVAEDAADFINLFKAADDQPL